MKRLLLVVCLGLCSVCMAGEPVRIAVFGGSVAQFFKERGAQAELEKMMGNYKFYNFGKAGDGLCKQTKIANGKAVVGGIPEKVRNVCDTSATRYDAYIIWCSTNDIWGNEIGRSSDYTEEDGFMDSHLLTQNGGLNYCIRAIQKHDSCAHILVLASLKSFKSPYGYSKTGEALYNPPRRMWDYVQGQIECAERFSLPVLNLWTESGINEYNYKKLCPDGIHPTKEGYLFFCPLLSDFIKRHVGSKE